MSSTVQTTSSTSSTPNFRLITDALVDYAKITGIDLSKNPFATAIERVNSPEAILGLLQEREKAFKDYREGNRRLISCLSPVVNAIQAFSGILGEAVSLVSHTCPLVKKVIVTSRKVPFPPAKAFFVGIDVLLSVRLFNTLLSHLPCDISVFQAASGVTSSYDALLALFESLGNFLKRLAVYTTIPPTPMMMDLVTKIMVELLSVLALATKQIKQGRFSKCVVGCTLLCSMCHREIRGEVVGERQYTGHPREIGSVDEGRSTVGCCTDLECRSWYCG